MGEVVYRIVFGARRVESSGEPNNLVYLNDAKPSVISTEFLGHIPFWDWPSDTEPPDESA